MVSKPDFIIIWKLLLMMYSCLLLLIEIYCVHIRVLTELLSGSKAPNLYEGAHSSFSRVKESGA